MNKIQKTNLFILPCFLLLASIACNKHEPKPENTPINETELITSMILQLQDSASGNTRSFAFRDSDGDGGNAPTVFDSIILDAHARYSCNILLLDESKASIDTISKEVKKEAEDHLFIFAPSSVQVQIQITDTDKNGLALGLESIWRSGNAGKGSIRITLKHQAGLKNGSPDPGETDAEVTFSLRIR